MAGAFLIQAADYTRNGQPLYDTLWEQGRSNHGPGRTRAVRWPRGSGPAAWRASHHPSPAAQTELRIKKFFAVGRIKNRACGRISSYQGTHHIKTTDRLPKGRRSLAFFWPIRQILRFFAAGSSDLFPVTQADRFPISHMETVGGVSWCGRRTEGPY